MVLFLAFITFLGAFVFQLVRCVFGVTMVGIYSLHWEHEVGQQPESMLNPINSGIVFKSQWQCDKDNKKAI